MIKIPHVTSILGRAYWLAHCSRLAKWIQPRSPGRFALVGGINTVMGVMNFPILYWLFSKYFGVNTLLVAGWALSTVSGFFLHKLVTFESKGKTHKELTVFIILALVTLGINVLTVNLAMRLANANPVLVQFITSFLLSAVLMILNYLGLKHLVFRIRPREKSVDRS